MSRHPSVETTVDRLKVGPGEHLELYYKGGLILFRVRADGTPEAFVAGKRLEVKDYKDYYADESDAG
jgi:hypothetical protein